MGKATIILITGAIVVLLLGSLSTLYVAQHTTQTTTDTITINHTTYSLTQLLTTITPRTFTDLNYTGIALDNLIRTTNITNPETHQYIITGSDGYQKTVTWDNLQHGLLTAQRMTVFTDLPKAFFVKDVITIEAKT